MQGWALGDVEILEYFDLLDQDSRNIEVDHCRV
jgi:hypothetical protein